MEPETEKRRRRRSWITPDSSWGYYCSKPCPWRRRRAMAEAQEACRRWGLSGSFRSFGLRLSWRGRCPATLRRREAWRGLRSWLRRWPLYWIWNLVYWRRRGWEDRVGLLSLGVEICWRMKLLVGWILYLRKVWNWSTTSAGIGGMYKAGLFLELYSRGWRSAFCLCRVLVLCTWIWHMLRYRWSLWLRSCPRPGFGGSGRRERCDVASGDGSYTYKDQRDYWVQVFARWEARSELWLLRW